MTFDLKFPTDADEEHSLNLKAGEFLFVLGANGTGKSSLMARFAGANQGRVKVVSAIRQMWMNSDFPEIPPSQKIVTEQQMSRRDFTDEARYRDHYAQQRSSIIIFDLVEAVNKRARAITKALGAEGESARRLAAEWPSPIEIINSLFREVNLPIEFDLEDNQQLIASKNGCVPFPVSRMSDGERSALLLAGCILTAPENILIIIDEPERHLHRSISAPLLEQLFRIRDDCAFVISTHDCDLPMRFSKARTLLLRSCEFEGENPKYWQADELPPDSVISDEVKRYLLGAREKILFVEGDESSLDKLLYNIIFPSVSVIPKGSCREVERGVAGMRAGEGLHWVQAFGIVDGDGFDEEQRAAKRKESVFALPYYSVESLYFHPCVIHKIAKTKGETREEQEGLFSKAIEAAIKAVSDHTERLSENISKKINRKLILGQIPNDDELLSGGNIEIKNHAESILKQRKNDLDKMVSQGDWQGIIVRCSIRESGARRAIAKCLGFDGITPYEREVRNLLKNDEEILSFIRGLFDGLAEEVMK